MAAQPSTFWSLDKFPLRRRFWIDYPDLGRGSFSDDCFLFSEKRRFLIPRPVAFHSPSAGGSVGDPRGISGSDSFPRADLAPKFGFRISPKSLSSRCLPMRDYFAPVQFLGASDGLRCFARWTPFGRKRLLREIRRAPIGRDRRHMPRDRGFSGCDYPPIPIFPKPAMRRVKIRYKPSRIFCLAFSLPVLMRGGGDVRRSKLFSATFSFYLPPHGRRSVRRGSFISCQDRVLECWRQGAQRQRKRYGEALGGRRPPRGSGVSRLDTEGGVPQPRSRYRGCYLPATSFYGFAQTQTYHFGTLACGSYLPDLGYGPPLEGSSG